MGRSFSREEVKKRLLSSLEKIAERNGYGSSKDYLANLAKLKRFPSVEEFEAQVVRQCALLKIVLSGKESLEADEWERILYTVKRRRVKRRNRILGEMIYMRLLELGRNQAWLARELHISREVVRQYMEGNCYPKKAILHELETVLQIKVEHEESLFAKPINSKHLDT